MKEVNKDKERLEEIEKRVLVDKVYYKYLDGTKGHWGKTYTLSEEDYNYLIERVQELEELEQEYVDLNNDFTKLALENKRYREALEEILNADCNLEGLDAERELDRITDIAHQALEGRE